MKFPNTFCSQQRSSPTFDDFLLSNYETIESNPHIVTESNDRNTNVSPEKRSGNRSVRPETRHVSRRMHYIDSNEDKESGQQHRTILEAPFVKMKEIHINPPRHPIREDSKKFRYFSSII